MIRTLSTEDRLAIRDVGADLSSAMRNVFMVLGARHAATGALGMKNVRRDIESALKKLEAAEAKLKTEPPAVREIPRVKAVRS